MGVDSGSAFRPDLAMPVASATWSTVPTARDPVFGVEQIALLGDLAVLLGSYAALVVGFELVAADTPNMGLWCGGLISAWLLVAKWRPYDPSVLARPFQSAYVAAQNTLLAGAIFFLLPLIGGPNHSRISNLMAVVVLATAAAAWRMLLATVVTIPTDNLVVVGAGWAGQALAEAIVRRPHAGMRIAAFVDADDTVVGQAVHKVQVHPISQLTQLVHDSPGQARVVLATPGEGQRLLFEQLASLAESGIEVVQMSTLYEQVTGCIPVRYLGSYWWAVLPRPTTDALYWFGKRTLDVVISLVGILLLAAMLPVLWPVLHRQTAGSPVFKQVRVGKHGRLFTVYKLRTLHAAAVAERTNWRKRKAGNHATRLCALIRAIGLDELPQLVNVLRGEMTLVGPRPYVPEEVAELQEQIPFFRARALVQPGLTGWAQINYGYGLSLEDEVEKLQRDLYYIGHQCTYLDLRIMLRTLALVARGKRPASRVTLSALPADALAPWPAAAEDAPAPPSAPAWWPKPNYLDIKYALDRVLAVAAAILMAPLLVGIALVVRLDSPGPIIFRQRRIGQGGRPFIIYKFRTMYEDAPVYSLKVGPDDPRVTRVGRFLRRSALDELPQLWNIVRGEMSWVGPRPEQPFLVESYAEWERDRLRLRPGLTGWWQIRRRESQKMREHVALDLYYVEHVSAWLDLKILLSTPLALWRE